MAIEVLSAKQWNSKVWILSLSCGHSAVRMRKPKKWVYKCAKCIAQLAKEVGRDGEA